MRTVPEILEQLNKTLTIPAAEYVPAIGDAFLLIDEALAAHRAQAGEAVAVGMCRHDSGEVHFVPFNRDAELSPVADGTKLYASPHQVAQQGQAGEAVAEVYSISAMRSDEDAYATVRLLHRASDQWGLRVRAGDKLYASLHQVAQPLSVEQITRCWYGTPNGYAPFARAVEAAFCEANDIKLAAPTKEQTNG